MILATHPSYPQSRAYVLKLHCDAEPAHGRFSGLIENVSTGRRFVFASADELIASLARDSLDIRKTRRTSP